MTSTRTQSAQGSDDLGQAELLTTQDVGQSVRLLTRLHSPARAMQWPIHPSMSLIHPEGNAVRDPGALRAEKA